MIPLDKLRAVPTSALVELNRAVVEEIRSRRRRENSATARTLTKGDLVKWQDRESGEWSHGVVEEVRRTRVVVKQSLPDERVKLWSIGASHLRFVTPD